MLIAVRMIGERESWNERYARGTHGSMQPDPFFLQAYKRYVEACFPHGGAALDVAGGVGRHAVWLAQRGWRVSLIDISEAAIEHARQNASAARVTINLVAKDMSCAHLERATYDLVLVFFYLERKILPGLALTLRPGGLLVYKTYTVEAPRGRVGGPSHPMYLLKHNELLRAFAGLEILHYEEPPVGKAVAEMVARKPLPDVSGD
jgi:tellurite methyltransferase